ncbi:uncharacterized protein LOC132844086 [Tachysurus vachellii]|uniref:uncharacterized protein LOC132844086 n=1 Tax=Tachysurus vachellii TaxID=175792 RepID=UPI00296B2ABC|nr:uncharacterized protein LOC132844086 [Tachysurus vachellii]
MKILLIFTLCLISDGGASKVVTRYSGGGILIKCKYDTAYRYNQKYFCKDSKSGCSEQIKTGDKNQWVNSGRFSLFDDTKSSEFWVMIRELTVQDTGTYHCGVNRTLDTDIYTPVELKVKQGSLVSREVTAYAGGRINIKCRHEDEYKDKSKTFCKIGTHQWCFNQNQTKPNSEWSHDGRFSIHDNRSAGFFSVFIRELIIEDTGTYTCGGVVFGKLEIYTVVTLNVTEDLSYEKSISKTVHVGGDLTVRCKYPQSLRGDPKFLCRGRTQHFACSYKDSVKESRKNLTIGGTFSLYDDRAKQIFTVSIRAVTKQDSEYWCGAEKAWTSDHGYKVYFTRINLKVTDPYVPVSTSQPQNHPLSSSSSSSSSSSTSSTSTSSSSPLLRLTYINKSWTTPASPPAGFPASTVITVSVIVLLLLIGTITVFVALQKRQKLQADSASTTSGQDPGNQVVPLDICEYEEIKDTRRLSASDAGNSTIYSTAELPTIPSDHHTVYANSKLPTSPYDSPVYPAAQLLTICSDQDIYSTAQLPTHLSAAEPDEGLNYTSVSFHVESTSSNDAAAKIIFKKTEVLSDYDSISHVTSSGYCPECCQTFKPCPTLCRNTMLAEAVEQLRLGNLSLTAHKSICNMCRAADSATSHQTQAKLKSHKLIIPTGDLMQKICPEHKYLQEFYCRSCQVYICCLCVSNQHKDHESLSTQAERTEKRLNVNVSLTAGCGYQPTLFPWSGNPSNLPAMDEWFHWSKETWSTTHRQLQRAIRRQKVHADRRRRAHPDYQPGQWVWLSTRDIRLHLPSRKLSRRYVGPFKIIKQVNLVSYRLALPQTYRISPTFHVSLLKPTDGPKGGPEGATDPSGPPPLLIGNEEASQVRDLLGSRHRGGNLEYLVDWEGYGPEERSWVKAGDILDPSLTADFHQRHTDRPAPRARGRPRRCTHPRVGSPSRVGGLCDNWSTCLTSRAPTQRSIYGIEEEVGVASLYGRVGVEICESELRMKILLIFTLCLISDGGESKEVTGYSGGGILIKCEYDPEYTENQKYFCKGSVIVCSDQIKTGDKNQWVNSRRFSLFDDTKSAEFWVMIRELTVQDTGTYHCGVDKTFRKDTYTPVELKVKEGSLVSREVTAYAGGRINIKCRHEDEYKDKSKSFCKIGTHQWCFNQKQTKPNSEWSHDGRFSIHDKRSAGFFSVFIRELIIEDTGTYTCGGVVFGKLEIYTVMTLNVTEDLSYEKSISKTVHVGGDLTVRCKYPQSLRGDPKFLCRGRTQDFACSYKDSVKESRKHLIIENMALYDDREKQIFNVSIRAVTKQDSEYWCGAEKAWTSDHGYKVYFTRINLTVTDPYVPVSTSKPTSPSSSSSSSLLLSSSTSTSSPLLRLTDINKSWTTPASTPAVFPASTVITVSIILLLLLIGTITIFVALQKRQKLQADSASTTSGQDPGNQVVPLDICEYEEIKDTRRLSASDAGNSTIYSTAELPTIHSDHHTVYANSKLPTSPYDSPVYPAAQLPTIRSDQDIYSTAQLPTRLSAAESDEGLNYTSVSFHAKSTSSNDASAKIIFKKTEVLCDYDSLCYVTSSEAVEQLRLGNLSLTAHESICSAVYGILLRVGVEICDSELRMKILLIFTLCLMSDGGASKEVTGYSGGGILIKCKYDTAYRYNQKYFCKGSMPGCSEQIKTGDKNQWVNSGRFSLFDDNKSSEFWVMITELTVQDTGTYHCGVDRTFGTNIYTPVELKVKEGSLVSREVTAYAGGRINIKCRYEDEYKDKSKSFCKIGTHQWCFNQKQTKPNSEWSHDGRFSIHDNRSAGFFSVFIRELNIEDTGTYTCGGVVFGKLEIYTVVTLNVTEDLSYEKSISKTVHVGGDLTVRCKYPQSLRSDPRSLKILLVLIRTLLKRVENI